FLVDDAIVFMENVIRRAEHGESILKAAYNTAGEISFTILSMTLSLAAVFIPLVFLPGLLGSIFQEFSITIIVAILSSGFVLLPPGDSGFGRGVFIAQEGSSPEQMRAFQKQVNEKIIADPSVAQFFTVAGSAQRSASSQGVIFCIFKPREQRDSIEQCLLRLQKSIATIPGLTAVISPSPVLQVNVGATNQTQGQYDSTASGLVQHDVYRAR